MKHDPFGNLTDWGPVLDIVAELAEKGDLSGCQPGLIRILRHKGNWRLREEVLKHIGQIQNPSNELLRQVLAILDDDNLYYDARILAGSALVQLMRHVRTDEEAAITGQARKVIAKLVSTPQPPFFNRALKDLSVAVGCTAPA